MSITVLCPSRGNPQALWNTFDSFHSTAMEPGTRFMAVVDADDPRADDYFGLIGDSLLLIHVVPRDESGNMNLALNYAARYAVEHHADVIGFVGDDHRFRTKGWDRVIEQVLADGGIAFGDDGARGPDLPTQVFITAGIVQALGWMGLPGAKHLYLDNTWKTLGERADCLFYLPDIVIEHMHPAYGKGEWDENHRRVNASEVYEHDARVYEAWLASDAEADIAKVVGALRPDPVRDRP